MFDRSRVHAALADFDELWCKLDAGTEEYFRLVDGTAFPFARVLSNLRRVARERPIVIQSLFMTYDGRGPADTEVHAYVARLRELIEAGGRIDRVQVYTVARPPADPRVGALADDRLEQIAARVRAAGILAEVYGSGD
jgi:wyosine [tRNA(Phe)-imidazoG37] synthetase (radical SAM superfamily)